MDPPPSSTVGFPLSGNPPSGGNSPPPPPPSSSVGIPLFEAPPQPSQNPPNPQPSCNGPQSLMFSADHWNREMANLYDEENFCLFLKEGNCEESFLEWYFCGHHAVEHGRNWDDCVQAAGVLRDCIFADHHYHKPLITYVWDRIHR